MPGFWIWEGTPQSLDKTIDFNNGRWRKPYSWEESRIKKGDSPWNRKKTKPKRKKRKPDGTE